MSAARARCLCLQVVAAGALTLLAACSGGNEATLQVSPTSPSAVKSGEAKTSVKVALLVPLSAQGATGIIGKSLKQAAELTLFERDNPSVQLIVKDDKGTPEGARAAAEDAIKGGASLILGPLFAKSVTAVAPVAQKANVPVIAFSNDRQVAGNGVYLLSFQPTPEINRVVAYAAQQGKRRFVALVPDDAFGALAAASFKDAVARVGGTVVALEAYPHSANGMLEPMRKISLAIQSAKTGESPVDALFVPGTQDNLDLIGRLLPQAEIDTNAVKLIGTGGMDYPNAGRNPRLVGAWYPAPDPRGWNDFSQKFVKSYSSAPPRIASFAHDGMVLATALSNAPAGQRYSAAEITRGGGFTGVDGVFRLNADGTIERSLVILEVQKFGAGVIDAAPALSPSAAPAAAGNASGLSALFNLN